MTRICDPFSYGDGPVAESFWAATVPLPSRPAMQGEAQADVAIIGAGVTGLNAALRLAQAGVSVAVLEAKQVGWGASGRNGGFCCLGGGMWGESQMSKRYGATQTRDFLLAERDAVDFVDQMITVAGWDVDRHREGDTILAHKPAAMAAIKDEAAHVDALFGDGGGGEGTVDHGGGGADEGDYGAVGAGAGVAVEEGAAGGGADGRADGFDGGGVAAFGEVGDALD